MKGEGGWLVAAEGVSRGLGFILPSHDLLPVSVGCESYILAPGICLHCRLCGLGKAWDWRFDGSTIAEKVLRFVAECNRRETNSCVTC